MESSSQGLDGHTESAGISAEVDITIEEKDLHSGKLNSS